MTKEELEAYVDDVFPQSRASLGWRLDEISAGGTARIGLELEDRHLRPGPTVSGPTLMALADVAMYFAVLAAIGRRPLAVTTSLNINFMRRCGEGTIIAEAKLQKLGKRLAVGEVTMHSGRRDAPIAHATMTYSLPPE